MEIEAVLVTYPETSSLNEAVGLAQAAGFRPLSVVTQKFLNRAKYGVGEGKAEEVKRLVKELGAKVTIIDERLRTTQAYNLAKLTGVETIDREKLILEIFRRRASSDEAKLQVKLAELRYEVPRAREKVRLAKKGEQPGFFGLGKYEVHVYYDDIKRRLANMAKKIERIRRRRALQREWRRRLSLPTVALTGYTGVGKTTLFNLLTGEHKEVGRGSFTTLATTTRIADFDGFRALVSDTVGYISRLPSYMIEAFKATLEDLSYSNFVLLLLDLSEREVDLRRKLHDCAKILGELQIPPSNVLLAFNKVDLCDREESLRKIEGLGLSQTDPIMISASKGEGVLRLKEAVKRVLFASSETFVASSRMEEMAST